MKISVKVDKCSYLVSEALVKGAYRYWLSRSWAPLSHGPLMGFVMLNPSTADGTVDDPTIRKCCGFAKAFSHSGIIVVNLYAYRSPYPRALAGTADPKGPECDQWITKAASRESVKTWVAAWGELLPRVLAIAGKTRPPARIEEVLRLINQPVFCFGLTKTGQPKHPARLGYSSHLQQFWQPDVGHIKVAQPAEASA